MSDEQSVIDFLARSAEHYRAAGSMMDAAMTLGVKALIERLCAENFALAANQCKAGYAGEHGDHSCHLLDALVAIDSELALDGQIKEIVDDALAKAEGA